MGFEQGGFGDGGFAAAREISVDLYTASYRVSGLIETRFSRVTEVLNQLTGGHLSVAGANVSEHADPAVTVAAPSALVAVDEILVMVAPDLGGASSSEMRIQKRPVKAQLGLPPLRVTGMVHLAMGSRPVDGLLHGADRFIAMTDATIESGAHPELARTVPVLALRRDRAHVLLVADEEHPDELLAEVLDERTAQAWLRPDEEEPVA